MPLTAAVRNHFDRLCSIARTDAELLRDFASKRDEGAFQTLVERHGPMVLRVCRNLLSDAAAAEDAFQATFLLLSRKAPAIAPRHAGAVAGWLFDAARRIALKACTAEARRRKHESCVRPCPGHEPPDALSAAELYRILDEELARLPEAHRLPLLLCFWQGLSQDEAARRLGVSPGAIKGRLERGRAKLAARLTQRGVAPAVLLTIAVGAAIPRELIAKSVGLVRPEAKIPAAIAVLTSSVAPRATRLGVTAALLLAVAGGLGLRDAWLTASPLPDLPAKEKPDARPEPTRVDVFGDPLPEGAIARLGSLRFYHGSQVNRVVLSPDGKWLVSLSEGAYRLWDARSGLEIPLAKELSLAPFFATGEKLIAVKKEAGGVVLFDALAGTEIVRLQIGPVDPVLSPDGKTLVWSSLEIGAGNEKGVLTFADAATGNVLQAVEMKDRKAPWAHVFSADSNVLATHYEDNAVDVWDVKTRKVLMSVSVKGKGLGEIALSPDGGTLAAAAYGEKRIRFWDVRAKKELTPLAIKPGRRQNSAVAFSPNGKFLAATYEAEVGLWDLATRKEIRRLKGKESDLSAPVFSRDGKRLAAGDGHSISIWDVATGQPCHDFGHIYAVGAVAFAPDGRTIASGAAYTDNVVRAWDPFTGQIKGRWRGHRDGIEAIAYSPDGKLVASGSQDGTVRLWDAATGKEVGCLGARDGMIYAMAFSPDGKTLASGGKRKVEHFWDVTTLKEVRAFDNPGGWTLRLAFSPDGKMLATRGFEEGLVRLWDVASGTELRQIRDVKAGCPQLSFTPDNRTLAVNCDDGMVRLFDVTTGRQLRSLGEPPQPGREHRCLGVVFAPDGRSLAATYDDTRVWEVVSGRERVRFRGHVGVPLGLAYSPDGALLVSGGSDHIALVWDLFGQFTADRVGGDFTREESERLLADLADADARQAFRALQRLLTNPKQAVALLKERVQRIAVVKPTKIDRLVADLGNEKFAVRENATSQLRELGDLAEPALCAALTGKPSPEMRRRVEGLLTQLDASPSPALLRGVRGIEVLERIGTPDARTLLQTLANGAPGARLTREAQASLARLEKK